MSEHKQITDLSEIVGRTIARATYLDYTGEIAIIFADGDYLFLLAETECGSDARIETRTDIGLRHRINLGVASERDIEIKRQSDEYDERNLKERRRLEYERLRAEFEGKEEDR